MNNPENNADSMTGFACAECAIVVTGVTCSPDYELYDLHTWIFI